MREYILNLEHLSPQIRQQALDMLVMTMGGMVVGALRTLDLLTLKRWIHNSIIAWFQEVLFWIIGGIVSSEFLYYCAYGAVSFHSLVSLFLGFFLWKRLFHGQMGTVFGIIKWNMTIGEPIWEHIYGKNETKPRVQERTRKQRHRHR